MPFFAVHQPVILAIAFVVVQWQAGIAVKLPALLASSLVVAATQGAGIATHAGQQAARGAIQPSRGCPGVTIGPGSEERAAPGTPGRSPHPDRAGVAGDIGEKVSWIRERNLEDARADFTAHAALYVLVMMALIVLNFSFLTGFW